MWHQAQTCFVDVKQKENAYKLPLFNRNKTHYDMMLLENNQLWGDLPVTTHPEL